MKKQYTIEDAYTDNYRVTTYNEGKKESGDIITYYEMSGYASRLESEGYSLAYDIDEYKARLEQAEEKLKYAKQMYETAVKNALLIK